MAECRVCAVWDNTYSRWRSKSLSYCVRMFMPPTDKDDEAEPMKAQPDKAAEEQQEGLQEGEKDKGGEKAGVQSSGSDDMSDADITEDGAMV